MKTVFDILAVLVFGVLVTLFLQRSQSDHPRDGIFYYLPAAAGCAVVNYIGNAGYHLAAVACLSGLLTYIWVFLKPLRK